VFVLGGGVIMICWANF